MYKKIECKSAITGIKGRFPYRWDLNIYRGCAHKCVYCFAMYSHDYLEDGDFFDNIYVKENIVEILEKELYKQKNRGSIINIGGVTDSYQMPLEQEKKTMRKILKLMIKYRNPMIISTKSKLMLRDLDLIDELSRIAYVNVACTITTTDETIRQKIEGGASSTKERFEVLRQIRKTNASIGIHTMPIIPFITDSQENLESIFSKAKEIGAYYLLTAPLNLRGNTRKFFLQFIRREFPDLENKYNRIFQGQTVSKPYRQRLYRYINILRKKYDIGKDFSQIMKEKYDTTKHNFFGNWL